jgi:D-alanine-D-alanine ligase
VHEPGGTRHGALKDAIAPLVARTRAVADDLRLLYVTNLRVEEELRDLGPDGVHNTAQHYTRREADEIVRSFQGLGLTVEPFFSEREFFEAILDGEPSSDQRTKIVYSTAEGGTGSGRRALLPALCNLLGLPILNCGAHASSLVRHKFHAYSVLRLGGVRVPETWQFDADGWAGGRRPPTGSRVIVKPAYESMGIGVDSDSVGLVDNRFDHFVEEKNRTFAQPAVVQAFISGEEVGVPVARIGATQALPPVAQRQASGESYGDRPKTFEDEHLRADLSHHPYEATDVQIDALRASAAAAFDALEMKGVGRIDFRVDADGRAWVFDTNGEPPPVAKTCWGFAMGELGFSLEDMLALWVGICLRDYGLDHESTQNESSQAGISLP